MGADFRVRGGVQQACYLVPAATDNLIVANYHRSERAAAALVHAIAAEFHGFADPLVVLLHLPVIGLARGDVALARPTGTWLQLAERLV